MNPTDSKYLVFLTAVTSAALIAAVYAATPKAHMTPGEMITEEDSKNLGDVIQSTPALQSNSLAKPLADPKPIGHPAAKAAAKPASPKPSRATSAAPKTAALVIESNSR